MDLTTGAATLVGAIDDGTIEIFGLAISNVDTDADGSCWNTTRDYN